jgi:hypothetical protein
VLLAPIVLFASALTPVAVLELPVVLKPSAKNAGGRVVETGRVVKERIKAIGRVVVAGGVCKESLPTIGRVADADRIAIECKSTGSRVVITRGVA